MKYTKDVAEKVTNLESRGYKSHINPNTNVLQMKKNCQLKLESFNNTDDNGDIVWTSRENGIELTLVSCSLKGHPDFKCKATLYKSSWEENPVEIGNVYSAIVSCNITQEGTNSLSPDADDSYFTLFSQVGTVVSNKSLANVGL